MGSQSGQRGWTFADIVGPAGTEAFVRDCWGRDFRHMRGTAGRFGDLFSWPDLENLLSAPAFPFEHLRLFRGGKELDKSSYVFTSGERQALLPGSLANLLGAGATLILDDVHLHARGPAEVARACEGFLGASTTVNLYAGWGRDAGFNLHWDWQDTIILQVGGRKAWTVFAPTRLDPVRDEAVKPATPTGDPIWTGNLEEGDVLYLPRGWWHVARPLDEPTLHLTVTIVPDTPATLAAWIAGRASTVDGMRRNIPGRMSTDQRREFGERFRRMLLELASDDLIADFLAQREAGLTMPARLRFPSSPYDSLQPITPHSLFRLVVDRHIHVVDDGREPGAFYANGARWSCRRDLLPALRLLRNDRAVSFPSLASELANGSPQGELIRILGAMAAGGAVWVEPAAG